MRLNKFIFVTDLDDVLNDLMQCFCAYFNSRYGTTLKYNNLREWDLSSVIPAKLRDEIERTFEDSELWNSLRPVKGSQDALRKLYDAGVEIRIVTATNPVNVPWKAKWIAYYYSFLPKDVFVVSAHKDECQADVILDDYENNMKHSLAKRLLMDRPWNKNFHEDVYGMTRVRNWDEICEIVLKEYDAAIRFERGGV